MAASDAGSNFIRTRIEEEVAQGKVQQVVTRFPPEPNGWPHIGHAKSICLNFGLAETFGGRCHLRFDDTNPEGESMAFAEAIADCVKWLGFDWGEHRYYASDYYEQLYQWAVELIRKGLAYVDESPDEVIRAHRGTVTEPGTPTPFRDRPIEESLDRFARMRAGEFADGAMVLRAKIDLANPNMKMRDPLMYRIRKLSHYRTGDAWCIYPFYDYAHGLSDALEGITHSLCTLEFENNRELYDWYCDHVDHGADPQPRQTEFARLSVGYTVTSKRKLKRLVNEGHVDGWDDPRLYTLAGLRRRGVRPEAVRALCERVGVARTDSVVDPALFEGIIRDDLDREAPRVMAVVDPVEVVVRSWKAETDWIEAPLWPSDIGFEGERPLPFGERLFIERSDFMAEPVKGFKRLAPGRSVRLLYGYAITYVSHETDAEGRVTRIVVDHDPNSRGGDTQLKVAGSIHWVSAEHGIPATVRLYDRLFTAQNPGAERDLIEDINPDSLQVVQAIVEPALGVAEGGSHWQFVRNGFFYADTVDSAPGAPVFNRVVALKDGWSKKKPAAEPVKAAPAAPAKVGDKPEPLHPERFAALVAMGVPEDEARVLTDEPARDALFTALAGDDADSVAKWLVNEVLPQVDDPSAAPVAGLKALFALVAGGTLTAKLARKVLPEVLGGGDPQAIVERDGLVVVSDLDALLVHARKAVAGNPKQVAGYRGGNERMLGFFVGQIMKATGGKADGNAAREAALAALAE